MFEERKQEFLDLFYSHIFPGITQAEEERIEKIKNGIITGLATIIIITIAACFIAKFVDSRDLICFIFGGFTVIYAVIADFFIKKDNYLILVNSMGIVVLILCVACFYQNSANLIYPVIVSSVTLSIYAVTVEFFIIKERFVRLIKSRYMNRIVSFFNNMKWLNTKDIKVSEAIKNIKKNPVFNEIPFNDVRIDDYFCGEYNNIKYTLQELLLVYRGRSVMQAFKGILLEFSFNISEGLLVSDNNMRVNNNYFIFAGIILFGSSVWFGHYLYDCYKDYGFCPDLVSLLIATLLLFICSVICIVAERNRNKMFKKTDFTDFIYGYNVRINNSEDIHEIVKPELTDILDNMKTAFNSPGISINTYNSNGIVKLSVIIPTKINAFEIGSLFKPLNKPECMSDFFNQLSSIMDLIDYFAKIEKESRD